jgi:hypothetical protein
MARISFLFMMAANEQQLTSLSQTIQPRLTPGRTSIATYTSRYSLYFRSPCSPLKNPMRSVKDQYRGTPTNGTNLLPFYDDRE